MADDTLQQAISLVKAGKDSEARGLLYHLVKTDPHNEMAWLWLTETMNESQRKPVLEQGLKFNPGSSKLQHALDRLRAKEAQAASKPAPPPKEEPRLASPIPTSAVDRSMMQTAQLAFLPEDEPATPQDNSQIRTAQLPPLPSQIDRSVMRSARYDISPDTITPDKLPPELQLPEKPVSRPAPKRPDQTDVKTSQLAFAPDEPVGKPVPQPQQAQTLKSAPPVVPAPPPDKIDPSLMKAARFEQAEPQKTGPLHVPPPPSAPGPVSTGSLKAPPPPSPSVQSPVSTGSLKASPQPSASVSQKPSTGRWVHLQ
jgi:hypothetical protein